METVVDALLEDDIEVSAEQKKTIIHAMEPMGLDRSQHELRVIE